MNSAAITRLVSPTIAQAQRTSAFRVELRIELSETGQQPQRHAADGPATRRQDRANSEQRPAEEKPPAPENDVAGEKEQRP